MICPNFTIDKIWTFLNFLLIDYFYQSVLSITNSAPNKNPTNESLSLRIKEYYQNLFSSNSRLPKPPLCVSMKGAGNEKNDKEWGTRWKLLWLPTPWIFIDELGCLKKLIMCVLYCCFIWLVPRIQNLLPNLGFYWWTKMKLLIVVFLQCQVNLFYRIVLV